MYFLQTTIAHDKRNKTVLHQTICMYVYVINDHNFFVVVDIMSFRTIYICSGNIDMNILLISDRTDMFLSNKVAMGILV